jgi:molybdopterin-binding protein
MKISGRNFIPGTIIEIKEGATTAHVRIEIAGGTILTASITNEAVVDLGLKTGEKVHALVKASDVMVAVGD